MIKREEILSDLSEMKGRLNDLSFSDKSFIESLYQIVLRRPFTRTGCGDCYKDAVIQMYTYLQKNEIMEKKSNYLLKAGVVLRFTDDNNIYTNFNMTDEAAERILKERPGAIGKFQMYPEDWEKRISGGSNAQLQGTLPPEEDKTTTASGTTIESTESEKEFIGILAEKLKSGSSKNSLKEEYKEHEIDGKKVTQRAMTDYLKKADELNAAG